MDGTNGMVLPWSSPTQKPQAGQGDTARAKLVLFEFGQNDPKMDSGVRLCRGPAQDAMDLGDPKMRGGVNIAMKAISLPCKGSTDGGLS